MVVVLFFFNNLILYQLIVVVVEIRPTNAIFRAFHAIVGRFACQVRQSSKIGKIFYFRRVSCSLIVYERDYRFSVGDFMPKCIVEL